MFGHAGVWARIVWARDRLGAGSFGHQLNWSKTKKMIWRPNVLAPKRPRAQTAASKHHRLDNEYDNLGTQYYEDTASGCDN